MPPEEPTPPRFIIVRARGEGDSTEVVGAIDGRVRRGERIGIAINPCAHPYYALVLINDAQGAVLISGHEGEVGEGVYNSLHVIRPDGSDVQLSSGARVIALFSQLPIEAGLALALAVEDDACPPGIDLECVTLMFDD